eukprot:XP_001707936.1 Hypothetical protein GL50803_35116 [Giardia lamblia ATCC 50803]
MDRIALWDVGSRRVRGLTAAPAPCPQAEGLLGPSPPPRGRRVLCVRLCAPVRGARPREAALYRK